MSYFDHVRCTACKAMLDPESLATVQGQGMSCPRCNAPLSLGDLFGLSAAYAEEESPDLSLDDLVAGYGGGEPAPPAPEPPPRRRPQTTPSTRPASRPHGRATSTGLVHRGPAPEDDDEPAPSALDAMRALRRK